MNRYLGTLLVLTLGLSACVVPRPDPQREIITAFDQPSQTELGRRFAESLAAHPGQSGVYVLSSGLDAFAARVGLIEQAERAIDLQVYIFHDDVTGRLLLGRLLAAAERGVRVRLLIDDIGSGGIDPVLAATSAQPNFEVRLFNPVARGPLPGLARFLDLLWRPRRLNHRMHNKLLAVDGVAGVVGGRNVGDEYFDAREGVNFADLDLLAVGPVVRELDQSFDLYWNSSYAIPVSAWRSLQKGERELHALRAELDEHLDLQRDSRFGQRLRGADIVQQAGAGELELIWAPVYAIADHPDKIVARGDALAPTLLTTRMRERLPEAQLELDIVSPYFVPRDKGVDHLVGQVARGVRVRVLTNSLTANDVPLVHVGYSRYRRPLLDGGVELFELRPSGQALTESHAHGRFGSSEASLHAKTFTIDRRTVFVGSLNLDPRSVDLNTELGLVIESEVLAERLARAFDTLTSPELCYALALEPHGRGERLVWRTEEAGHALELTTEPDTSGWRRFNLWLLKLLPIEGQL